MSDGATFGLGADKAMRAVIGGQEPTEDDLMSVAEMTERILSAKPPDGPDKDSGWTYDDAANYAARLILEYLLADPKRASIPTENVYERGADGFMTSPPVILEPGLYDVMKRDGIPIDDLGLSGFMWGWAVNAARRCVQLPEVPNPAIMTITVPDP